MSARDCAAQPTLQRLLRQVARRQRLASAGRRFHLFVLAFAGAYCVGLVVSRLLALMPDWFPLPTLLTVPAAALVGAVLFHWRPCPAETARRVDAEARTDDLFLTIVLLDGAPGDYKPLVLQQAAERAGALRPAAIVPLRWLAKATHVVAALGLLALGVALLPQLDPFGKEAQRQEAERRRREFAERRRQIRQRTALLRKSNPDARLSEAVDKALQDLQLQLSKMRQGQAKGNSERIELARRDLGELWRRRGEQRLRDALRYGGGAQRLGGVHSKKARQWEQQLRKGRASGLQKEVDQLKKMAHELRRLSDPARKRALREQMRRRLETLRKGLQACANSQSLQDALRRTLEQLSRGEGQPLSPQQLEALAEALELVSAEIASLGQSIRDVRALEEALKLLQLAKMLNGLEALDGQACKGCQGLGDYAALFRRLMAGRKTDGQGLRAGGQGDQGDDLGGAGQGRGGKAPEDPKAKTAFQSEQSKSHVRAGKFLLKFKSGQGVSDPGKAREAYRRHIRAVRQGVGEAILTERVPPGYHDAIRQYFDSLKEDPQRK